MSTTTVPSRRSRRPIRRLFTRALAGFWVVALALTATHISHHEGLRLLGDAFALTLVWFVVCFPGLVFGTVLVSVGLSAAAFSRRRR